MDVGSGAVVSSALIRTQCHKMRERVKEKAAHDEREVMAATKRRKVQRNEGSINRSDKD